MIFRLLPAFEQPSRQRILSADLGLASAFSPGLMVCDDEPYEQRLHVITMFLFNRRGHSPFEPVKPVNNTKPGARSLFGGRHSQRYFD